MGTGLPQKVMVKHKYVTTVNLEIGTGLTPSTIVMRANSLFDPEYATGGHQPLYFDQYSALYNHYTVIGSRIKYTIVNADIQENQHAYSYVAYLDDNASLPPSATMEGLAEQTLGRNLVTVPGSSNNVHHTSLSFSAKKTWGGSILANVDLQGTPTTNPDEDQYFILALRGGLTTGANLVITMHVEYIAIWRELKDVEQS